ncbi:hypothetical protein NKV53_10190 [Legionella sp. 27cVA30]|uniref:hypothetical protein n=1 Tax=Legionella sp. 27cVA30 TaxID=2905657 RepID=UPI00209FC1AA|nr:hypothetical protein [Legionella sp. 27cVA30]MCP0914695.1 hypothetical protein [Legionella sp. 27cVA30]
MVTLQKDVSPENFLSILNELVEKIEQNEEIRHALTTISIKKPSKFYKLKVFESEVKLYKNFPPKFAHHRKALLKTHAIVENHEYVKCVITTKTNSSDIDIHLNNFEVFRALLCLLYTHEFHIKFDNQKNPLNKVMLGYAHTLHNAEGEALGENIWYEPQYYQNRVSDIDDLNKKKLVKIISKIHKCKYSDDLKKSLIMYVKALDEFDHNISIMLLWNGLDVLLNEKKGNYENISKRIKCIFGKKSHELDVINALRVTRNQYVHEAIQNNQSKYYCLTLRTLFYKVFAFYLNYLHDCKSKSEALEIIDQLNQIAESRRKIKRINKSIKIDRILKKASK